MAAVGGSGVAGRVGDNPKEILGRYNHSVKTRRRGGDGDGSHSKIFPVPSRHESAAETKPQRQEAKWDPF